MEYAGEWNLAQVREGRSDDIPSRACPILIRQLFEVYMHIHSKNLIHRDVKPHNIIVVDCSIPADKWKEKLCDFAFSKVVAQDTRASQIAASTLLSTDSQSTGGCWIAPEVLTTMGFDTYKQKSDTWGLGCVIFWLFEGRSPFKKEQEVWQAVHDEKLRLSCLKSENVNFDAIMYDGGGDCTPRGNSYVIAGLNNAFLPLDTVNLMKECGR